MTPRSPHDLRPHKLNRRIYGDEVDDDLAESIRAHGSLTPLVITEDNLVTGGRARTLATGPMALRTGGKSVAKCPHPAAKRGAPATTGARRISSLADKDCSCDAWRGAHGR